MASPEKLSLVFKYYLCVLFEGIHHKGQVALQKRMNFRKDIPKKLKKSYDFRVTIYQLEGLILGESKLM